MGIEEVSKVAEDGRIRLPHSLREKYAGRHMAVYESASEEGTIILEKVEVSEE